jgi:hypothetical protein
MGKWFRAPAWLIEDGDGRKVCWLAGVLFSFLSSDHAYILTPTGVFTVGFLFLDVWSWALEYTLPSY